MTPNPNRDPRPYTPTPNPHSKAWREDTSEWVSFYSGKPSVQWSKDLTATKQYGVWTPDVCRLHFKARKRGTPSLYLLWRYLLWRYLLWRYLLWRYLLTAGCWLLAA